MSNWKYTDTGRATASRTTERGELESCIASALPPDTPIDPEDAPTPEAMQALVVDAVQLRLDAFARTRAYDGILSACTYATSSVTKFQAEGQYCVDARDATWSACYAGLAAVQAGTQAMPATVADAIVQLQLPELVWPAA